VSKEQHIQGMDSMISHRFVSKSKRRMEMKALGRFLTVVLLISFLAACGAPATPAPEATKAPEAEITAAEQWAKDNGVGPYIPKTEDWAAI
jgi:hypothetical protein